MITLVRTIGLLSLLLLPLKATALPKIIHPTYRDTTLIAYASTITPLIAPRSLIGDLDANERYILLKESGMNPRAKNPRSTAFGYGQLLLGNRLIYAKKCKTTHDTIEPTHQICMFRGYVADRYGSSVKAAEHSRKTGWY